MNIHYKDDGRYLVYCNLAGTWIAYIYMAIVHDADTTGEIEKWTQYIHPHRQPTIEVKWDEMPTWWSCKWTLSWCKRIVLFLIVTIESQWFLHVPKQFISQGNVLWIQLSSCKFKHLHEMFEGIVRKVSI